MVNLIVSVGFLKQFFFHLITKDQFTQSVNESFDSKNVVVFQYTILYTKDYCIPI